MNDDTAPTAISFAEHLRFFDTDGDGHISIGETRAGFARLGFGHAVNLPAALVVNLGIAALGAAQGRPASPLRLPILQVSGVRHPDTVMVDEHGHFDARRLDVAFARYGHRFGGQALTLAELARMVVSRAWRDAGSDDWGVVLTVTGLSAVALEWGALFWVAYDEWDGRAVLEKETVRRFYRDAQFFEDIAERIARRRAGRAASLRGRARNLLQALVI